MRISEVAKQAGIRASAIRYYERIGLLPPPRRIGGWRVFQRDALDYLTVIRFGIRTGFTLRELRLLLGQDSTRRLRKSLAQVKLRQLRRRREQLQIQEKLLADVKLCRCGTVRTCVERLRRIGALRAEL